jgi:hypothetical protein
MQAKREPTRLNGGTVMTSNLNRDPSDLAAWLNPSYVDSFRRGKLHEEWCAKEPFKFAVLENFLLPFIVDEVHSHCRSIRTEKSSSEGLAKNCDWYWGAFDELRFLRFFFGPTLRKFLNALLDEEISMKSTRIPQYNIFNPRSPGIPIHNDLLQNGGDVVTLLQLSKGYEPGSGGELVFFRKQEGKMVRCRAVPPILNTFVIFKVCRESFHGVADLKGDWYRENLAYDWFTKAGKSLDQRAS